MFGLFGRIVGTLIGQAAPVASRVGGAGVAALAGLLVVKLGVTEDMAAESAAAVLTLVTLLVYALTHKVGSKVTNPSDDATPGRTD